MKSGHYGAGIVQCLQQGTILRLAARDARHLSCQARKQNLTQTGAVLYPSQAGAVLYLPINNMKFYYVYVLYNKEKDFIYIGYSENLLQRVKGHNKGLSKSTKAHIPLELIHYEAYGNIKDAKRRENTLKQTKVEQL